MSLKAFHVAFITLSTVLSVFLVAWGFRNYLQGDDPGALGVGSFGVIGIVLLVPYGRWFLQKMRHLPLPLIMGISVLPHDGLACAVCYGDPNAAISHGLRLGVLFLVGVVALVLASIAGIALSWRRRAQRQPL